MVVSGKINTRGKISTLTPAHQDTKFINTGKTTKGSGVAAVFRKSTLADYNDKELSQLQKSMLNLQDQIGKIQDNDDIDSKTKKELLENLNSQLEEVKAELEKASAATTSKTDDDNNKKSTAKDSKPTEQSSQDDVVSMGSDLKQVKAASSTSVKLKMEAKLEKNELNRAINDPNEHLRLTVSDIITKRQDEIDRKNDSVETLNSLIQDVEKNSKTKVNNTKKDPKIGGSNTEIVSASDNGNSDENAKKIVL
ncbi:hypothetical protein SAMN05660742_102154 [Propionispira arboris]|uniref:FlxA-like protein n=1 Tax=Propionispira arboris TaxID=84035 RepID=A0A1H6VCW5_9FIRM|nr:hypothetical protein [Propionispira arboris]SEI98035.1 hypothetical protein SAMN05660742_102154 [Propionispira arboris]